jgi:nucleoside-diphosphate-sugar epimerase
MSCQGLTFELCRPAFWVGTSDWLAAFFNFSHNLLQGQPLKRIVFSPTRSFVFLNKML